MSKRAGLALFLGLAVLFLWANRSAYRGFFQADEMDNLSWTPLVPAAVYAKLLITPAFQLGNFRPVGHLYFRIMSEAFGLDFPKYLLVIHLLHLLAVWLVWMLLRSLKASPLAAGAGALFFSFHMAVLDIYWKPMYVFDLLCGVLCLASLLFWIKGRWVLSFLSFWLAYKSKELAVMLPAVLVCYEWWLGERRWKPLAPFLLASLWFGVQGIFNNSDHDNEYTFRFTPAALATTARFYSRTLLDVSFGGILLLALPAFTRDRRVWLGVAASLLFLMPLLFLPGRLYSAYWYVPLIGVALALGSLADGRARPWVAAFLLAWIPWSYVNLRHKASDKLAVDAENRDYFNQLKESAPWFQDIPLFFYDGLPPSFPSWGLGGAVRYLTPHVYTHLYSLSDPATQPLLQKPALAMITWVEAQHKLYVVTRHPDTPDASYLAMDRLTPIWQLTDGWFDLEDRHRWIAPNATARLHRPPAAARFEVVFDVGAQLIAVLKHSDVRVRINGVPVGAAHLTDVGIHTLSWPIPAAPPGAVEAELEAEPPFHAPGDPRTLGIAIAAVGFPP